MWKWKTYVPVKGIAKRAEHRIKELKKINDNISPVIISGRKITKNFWGEAWCRHIESFSDYENRLPRGRSYLRNGAVCDLSIAQGHVMSLVQGGLLYEVNVVIEPLPLEKWEKIKLSCQGKIDSLLDLLQGHLSDGIMRSVTDQVDGLFPSEKEINWSCQCLDWGRMCKHVAATLYGVGHRLDLDPKLLFELRGIDINELISSPLFNLPPLSEEFLPEGELAELFGIDLGIPSTTLNSPSAPVIDSTTPKTDPLQGLTSLTGDIIRKLRLDLGLSLDAFAYEIGVSANTIRKWESLPVIEHLDEKEQEGLIRLLERMIGDNG